MSWPPSGPRRLSTKEWDEQSIASSFSSSASPRSIEKDHGSPAAKRGLEALIEETKGSSGLYARITGTVQVDDHQEYQIRLETWDRLGDADRGLPERLLKGRMADGRMKVVAECQRRYRGTSSLSTHPVRCSAVQPPDCACPA